MLLWAPFESYLPQLWSGQPRQPCHGLPLLAGRDNQRLVTRAPQGAAVGSYLCAGQWAVPAVGPTASRKANQAGPAGPVLIQAAESTSLLRQAGGQCPGSSCEGGLRFGEQDSRCTGVNCQLTSLLPQDLGHKAGPRRGPQFQQWKVAPSKWT